MDVCKKSDHFASSNGYDQIAYYIYKPTSKPIAIIQIAHGMCEYIERYEPFIRVLISKGIMVCGNDYIGHGKTAKSKMHLGYFGGDLGSEHLVEDLHTLSKIVKYDYPRTPYYLLGNNMGALIAKLYIAKYGDELDGAILMGISSSNYMSKAGIKMLKSSKLRKGDSIRNEKIQQKLFDYLNSKISNSTTKYDWLSRSKEALEAYQKDEYCNFTLTTNGFAMLYTLLEEANEKKLASIVPTNLPILILSGHNDPVGENGAGPKKIYELFKKANIEDISLKLYTQARHDILFDINMLEVYGDIVQWIKGQLPNDEYIEQDIAENYFNF